MEVNFIGMDKHSERAGETYLLEDDELPLIMFAQLSLLSPGKPLRIEGLEVPLPRPAGLLLEKLVTDRRGEKGERDLLVALALLLVCEPPDVRELEVLYRGLPEEQQYAVRSALSLHSLLAPHDAGSDAAPPASCPVAGPAGNDGAGPMTSALQRRLQRIREAGVIRGWEYRQRNSAKGVWYRLRRVLLTERNRRTIPERSARWVIGRRPLDTHGAFVVQVPPASEPVHWYRTTGCWCTKM